MKRDLTLLAAILGVLLLVGTFASFAQAAQQQGLSDQDKKFVQEAASGGMMEVRLGETASTKAASDDVKAFGKMMVKEHSAANQELMQVAQKKGMDVPKEMKKEQQESVERLTKLSGPEFDREYMGFMVKDHQKDIESYQKQVKEGQDPDIKAYATKTLPTLEEHLKRAKEIQGKLK